MAKIIMTVDGCAGVRKTVGFTLRQYGYAVVEAVDGKDALRQMKCRKVDMIRNPEQLISFVRKVVG